MQKVNVKIKLYPNGFRHKEQYTKLVSERNLKMRKYNLMIIQLDHEKNSCFNS